MKIPTSVKFVITDFDGIVTDNCVYIDAKGEMSRKLNFKDIMAFSILKKRGYKVGIISGEENSAIEVLKQKFDIEEVHQNIRNKLEVLKFIIDKYNLKQDEYIYIGDDINDIESLMYADIRITVPNAIEAVKQIHDIQITTQQGGNGAFREVVDCLINS
ncbi:MAG: KdsC family phosphatase [Candidatus Gastranaerophilaceae bacterium]